MGAAESCPGTASYSTLDLVRNGTGPERRRAGMSDTVMSTEPFMLDEHLGQKSSSPANALAMRAVGGTAAGPASDNPLGRSKGNAGA